MARQAKTYQQLKQELEAVLANLQADNLDVDAAVAQYERGRQLIAQLQEYLKTAENKVTLRHKATGQEEVA